MAKLIYGDRIGRTASIRLGCSAALFDAAREKVLLTRRADNGLWCLPGGGMDPGESAAETCEREMLEETGLQVRSTRLVGVYSDPNLVIQYADGNRFQIVALSFEVEQTGGELILTPETTAAGFYSPAEIETLDLMSHHRVRIADLFAQPAAAMIK